MGLKTRAELKTFYQTGDRPTENNYIDLIDSMGIVDVATVANLPAAGDTGRLYQTGGYTTVGDGGANTYYWSYGSAATVDGVFVLTGTGGRWIAVDQTKVSTLQAGWDSGASIANQTLRVQAAIDALESVGGGTLEVSAGSYTLTGLTVTESVHLIGAGRDLTTLDFSTATEAYALDFLNTKTTIEDLTSDAAINDRTLTFVSAPTLAVGDCFVVHNTVANSWSGYRTEYHEGDWFEALSISGAVVTVRQPSDAVLTAANCDVYRVQPMSPILRNMTLIGGATSTGVVRFEFCKNARVANVSVRHVNNSCIAFSKCYDFRVDGCSAYNVGDAGNDYGISVSNSKFGVIEGCEIYARRHAVTHGGDATAPHPPTRRCRTVNCDLSCDTSASVYAYDTHGNSQHCSLENSRVFGGVDFGGSDQTITGNRIVSADNGISLYGTELRGGKYIFTDNTLIATADPSAFTRGYIDAGGNGIAIGANTVSDMEFIIHGNLFEGPSSASTLPIDIRNRGATIKVNVDCQYNTFRNTSANGLLYVDLVSGTAASDFIVFDNNLVATANAYGIYPDGNYSGLAVLRQQSQSGSDLVVTPTDASSIAFAAVVYKVKFPRAPHVTLTRSGSNYAGNRCGIMNVSSPTSTGFTPMLVVDDATNWSGAINITCYWTASIAEV